MKQLRKLQLTQLKILEEVHMICQKYDIKYYLIGGTLLGAVRHKGFIPWDTDIDIAMKRDDYERFANICLNKLTNNFSYIYYKNQKKYYSPHAKVCLNDTMLIYSNKTKNLKHENKCIYIDVFPLDNVPFDKKKQKKQRKLLKTIKKIRYYKMGTIYKKGLMYSIGKYLLKFLFYIIPSKLLNKLEDQIMKKYNKEDSTHIANMASHYDYYKQVMDKNIYGKPQLIEFEGKLFYAPEKTHEYLVKIYGDYMKIPSEDERNKVLTRFKYIKYD